MGAVRYQDQVTRQGKNTSGSDILKGVAVKLKASPAVPDEIDLEATNTGAIYGVTGNAIENGRYGDVVIRGRAEALAGAAIAAGVRVMASTGGKLVTATAGNSVAGLAVTAASADGDFFELELIGPGGCEMPG